MKWKDDRHLRRLASTGLAELLLPGARDHFDGILLENATLSAPGVPLEDKSLPTLGGFAGEARQWERKYRRVREVLPLVVWVMGVVFILLSMIASIHSPLRGDLREVCAVGVGLGGALAVLLAAFIGMGVVRQAVIRSPDGTWRFEESHAGPMASRRPGVVGEIVEALPVQLTALAHHANTLVFSAIIRLESECRLLPVSRDMALHLASSELLPEQHIMADGPDLIGARVYRVPAILLFRPSYATLLRREVARRTIRKERLIRTRQSM